MEENKEFILNLYIKRNLPIFKQFLERGYSYMVEGENLSDREKTLVAITELTNPTFATPLLTWYPDLPDKVLKALGYTNEEEKEYDLPTAKEAIENINNAMEAFRNIDSKAITEEIPNTPTHNDVPSFLINPPTV